MCVDSWRPKGVFLVSPARRLLVNQAVSTFRVEPECPVSDDLQPHITDPRRILTPTSIVYLGQHKEPAALSRILGMPSLNDANPIHQNLPVTQSLCPWQTSESVRHIDSDFAPFGNPLNEYHSLLAGIRASQGELTDASRFMREGYDYSKAREYLADLRPVAKVAS